MFVMSDGGELNLLQTRQASTVKRLFVSPIVVRSPSLFILVVVVTVVFVIRFVRHHHFFHLAPTVLTAIVCVRGPAGIGT